jgi:hypothetical protein
MLHGFFQNWVLFPEGAQFHVPRPQVCKFDAMHNFTNTYFIHFRLGDYVDSQYDIGLDKYYIDACRLLSGGVFLIFSDEPDKVNLTRYGLTADKCVIVPKNVGVWETLYLMSLCAGGICANSTVSWFGAFGCWSRTGSKLLFMPDTWIKNKAGSPVPKWATALPCV